MAVQPKLRFKGFTDDWEKRQLGNVVDKIKSYSLSRDVEYNESTGYKYVHYGDIHTGKADIINKKSVLPNIKPSQYTTLSVNDLIVTDASEDYQGIASPAVIQELPDANLVAGLHTIALRPQATNATFLYYLLHTNNFKHFGYRTGTGLKVFGISWPNLSKFEFNLPGLEEQDKVVDLLRFLDNLITVNQRKVNLLKKKKTAYLQKLFPKTGSNIPELRFKGYIDAWEKRQLDDVVEKQIKGKAQLKKLNAGKVEYLDTVRLNGGSPILTDGIQDVSQDDILILWDGSKAGTVYSGFEGTLGSTLKEYRTSVNSQFVYQFLRLHQKNIYSNYRTPNIPHVQKDFLNVFKIDIPRFEEQRKIGDFLSSLDNLITVNQRLNQKSIILLSNYIYAVKKPPELTDDLHLLFICIIFCYLYNVLDYYKLQNNKL